MGFIGLGKVGSALAILLHRAGYTIAGVAGREAAPPEELAERLACAVLGKGDLSKGSDLLLITTPDDLISPVAASIAAEGAFHPGQIVLHMSGVHTSKILDCAAQAGAITLSVHPIQSFATVEQALSLIPGTYFSIEGDPRGYQLIRELVEKLGGKHFILDSQAKVLYHAAASVACNYMVALLSTAFSLLEQAGVPEEVRIPAFMPLIKGTIGNIEKLGIPEALTGPISRGDQGTVQKHLQAMGGTEADIYRSLGLVSVDLALQKGTIKEEQAKELRLLLS